MSKKEKKQKNKAPDEKPRTKDEKDEKSPEKEKESKEKKMKTLLKKAVVAVILLVIIIIGGAVGLYFYSPMEKYTRPVFKSVPYPVAVVGDSRSMITSRELIKNTDAVRKFYEGQDFKTKGLRVDFNTEQGQMRLKVKEKDVFDKLIENKMIEQLANEKGIFITKSEVQEKLDEKIAQYGDAKTLELSLGSLYGWDIAEFRDNVVIHQIYLKRLYAAYALEVSEQEGYQKALNAKSKIDEDGSNFVDVVREFSEGESAENDGELGWFRYHQLIPEVADEVYSMETGAISDVIVSPVGFHVVHLQETREQEIVAQDVSEESNNGTQTIKEVKIRQVYVHGQTFLDWLMKKKQETKVMILMKDYSWNSQTGFVEFRDPGMKKNEKLIRMNSQGDPSLKVIK